MAILLDGEIGYSITAQDIIQALNDGHDEIILSSYGGDLYEGLKIKDVLSMSDKIKSIGVMGVCASACIPAILGVSDRWGSPNSRFLIHNPWTETRGESKDLALMAEELQKEQNILVKMFSDVSGKTVEEIQAIMNKSTFLTAEEALELKIITRIKNEKMGEIEVKEKFSFFDGWFNKITNQISNLSKPKIKNEIIQTADGTELDFGVEEAEIGKTATVGGVPANGEYTMASGEVYVFENGTLTEIRPNADGEDVSALKQANEDLTAKNLELEAKIQNLVNEKEAIQNNIEALKADFKNVVNEFTAFKNQFSTEKIQDKTEPPAPDGKTEKKAFYTKK